MPRVPTPADYDRRAFVALCREAHVRSYRVGLTERHEDRHGSPPLHEIDGILVWRKGEDKAAATVFVIGDMDFGEAAAMALEYLRHDAKKP